MTSNPSPAPTPDLATPRPWRQTGTAARPHWYVTSADVLVHGPRMDQTDMAPETYVRWIADAALIVAAVNDYDRLRAIEAAAKVWKAEQEALTAKWRAGEPGVHFEDMRVVQDAEEAMFALLDAAIQGGSET